MALDLASLWSSMIFNEILIQFHLRLLSQTLIKHLISFIFFQSGIIIRCRKYCTGLVMNHIMLRRLVKYDYELKVGSFWLLLVSLTFHILVWMF